jgi:3-deoxy-D-manno-octulosonic-acid transferase
VVIVNGRISDHSFRGYFMIKFLLHPILNRISLFCMQGDDDARRLMALGVSPDKLRVNGNMKFDIGDNSLLQEEARVYRNGLGLTGADKLWVCGSTHPGEEEAILGVFQDLLKDYPSLRLLIAPRHPERSVEIEGLIQRKGFLPLRLSQLDSGIGDRSARRVFILDSVGQLMRYYAASDVVFMGGSLVKKGGHNILEPAALARPVIFGPYMFNFRDIARLFLRKQAAVLVHNKEELKVALKELLDDPGKAEGLGARGQGLISDNRGATRRNLESLKSFLLP